MSAVSFPLRPSSSYKPKAPADSYLRTGYHKTASNPRGYHWGVDCPAPTNTIIQLPEKAKLIDKGRDMQAGYWMEWLILAGPWKGRYWRAFHMRLPCGIAVGSTKNRKYAVGRVDCTGYCTGPHLHSELGKYRWDKARDPRWNITQAYRDAVRGKDY